MLEGKIAQISTPEVLYRYPESLPVAEFIGSMNFLRAKVGPSSGGRTAVEVEGLGIAYFPADRVGRHANGDSVIAGVRPERLTILFGDDESGLPVASGQVADRSYHGDMTSYDVALDGTDSLATVSMRNTANRPIFERGVKVSLSWDAETIVLFRQNQA